MWMSPAGDPTRNDLSRRFRPTQNSHHFRDAYTTGDTPQAARMNQLTSVDDPLVRVCAVSTPSV